LSIIKTAVLGLGTFKWTLPLPVLIISVHKGINKQSSCTLLCLRWY